MTAAAAVAGAGRRAARGPAARPLPEPVAPWPLAGREQDLAPLDRALVGGRGGDPVVRRADRRAGHRQDPARRRARAAGPRPRRPGAGRPLLAGRRRAAAVAVAGGAGRDRRRACADRRAADEDEGAQFRAWERIASAIRAAARDAHARWWCSTTCTGRTPRRCGCCGCWSRRRPRRGCWSWRPGGRTPSRPGCWPTSPRRWPGGTPCASSCPGCRPRRSRSVFASVASDELGPGGARAAPARAHRRQPVLPRGVRAAGGGAGAARRSCPTTSCRPRSSEVLTRRLARLPDEHRPRAADRGGDRPPVRHPDAGRGDRDRRGRPARRGRAGAGRRAGPRGRHRPVPVRPRAGARHAAGRR